MLTQTQLTIRRTPGCISPLWQETSLNELYGGPETLIRWLETQLGLPVPSTNIADRITEYASALDSVTNSVISASLLADRWATASELLSRRDELLLAGWDETESDQLPPMVRDLAQAVEGRTFAFPGEAERLRRVLDALEAGQELPPHKCLLLDPVEWWPLLWQEVLSELTLAKPTLLSPHAPVGSALNVAQNLIRGGEAAKLAQDTSLRYLRTRSNSVAIEFVAAVLSTSREQLPTTVIYCEDDNLALQLDACLHRMGLPTCGSSVCSRAHPVLQVLPLSLALCWEPVDPQVLLDFLSLPVLPLPRQAASRLAHALTQEPGLGSGAWERALAEICQPEQDPKGKLQTQIQEWLLGERVAIGSAIPSHLVRTRASSVAQWAAGRAAWLAEQEDASPELIIALKTAAGQASLLGQLAESQGVSLSQPQLARLVEESIASGVETTPHLEGEGGPIRVRSLAEIVGPCDRLIWLGVGIADARACRWSTSQLKQLSKIGIILDDGSHALASLRAAEARGFNFVKETLLAVLLPQDGDRRWHPLWLAIRGLLQHTDSANPPVLEDLVTDGEVATLAPFEFPCNEVSILPPQPPRSLWHLPAELLADRETVSATELQDRLGCPLKWTLNYLARLSPSDIAVLPNDFQLKGIFCHSILERVFGEGGELPSEANAVTSVLECFDQRLPLDAAPLARPDQYNEYQKLRGELEHATRILINTLAAGGYRIVGIEVALSGKAFEKELRGWIDCVAERQDGQQAIIDFKYGGRNKYRKLLEQGKAVQLATYAIGRKSADGTFPAVAYLLLADGLLYTPSGSPIAGDGNHWMIDGPAIETVWQVFAQTIGRADRWLQGAEPVPARPLQDPSEWPEGTSIVLEDNLRNESSQEVCRYCDYKHLCGLKEVS